MKGKKAITTKILIYGILVMIFLAFFIKLIVDLSLSEERYGTEQVCRNSVRLAAYKISGKSIYNEIKCPTQYDSIQATEDEAIKHEIAEKMRTCYWMFHEGKLELFDENSENFCVICYVLDFKEKKKVSGVVNYLMIHNLPESPDTSYYDYLTPYSTTQELIEKTQNSKEDFVDTNYKYAVMFNYVKPSYLSKMEAGEIGAAGAGVTALVITYFIPGVNIFTISGTAIAVGVGAAAAGTGFYFGKDFGEVADWSASMMLWPYTEEEAARIQCNYAPVKTK